MFLLHHHHYHHHHHSKILWVLPSHTDLQGQVVSGRGSRSQTLLSTTALLLPADGVTSLLLPRLPWVPNAWVSCWPSQQKAVSFPCYISVRRGGISGVSICPGFPQVGQGAGRKKARQHPCCAATAEWTRGGTSVMSLSLASNFVWKLSHLQGQRLSDFCAKHSRHHCIFCMEEASLGFGASHKLNVLAGTSSKQDLRRGFLRYFAFCYQSVIPW